MKQITRAGILVVLILAMSCATKRVQPVSEPSVPGAVSQQKLLWWPSHGLGELKAEGLEDVQLSEASVSRGFIMLSPKSFGNDVILSYRVKPLTPDTVLVAILSLSDSGESTELTVPPNYNGAIEWLLNDPENYFFAFCNRAHDATPFVRRHPGSGEEGETLASAEKNVMEPGVWYDIEVGKEGARLWLKVDGETILETEDSEPLGAGWVALRIRGTEKGPASCLIRDVSVR